jgi:hypothetical protein
MKKILLFSFLITLISKSKSEKFGCDFETPCTLLGFDNFWGLTSGEAQFGPNAPDHDHTFDNSSGHYMFFDLSSGEKYKDSTVQFLDIINYTLNTPNEKKCLQFYYILNSDADKNLTVNLVLGDNQDIQATWLTINTKTNSSNDWSMAEISLPNDAYSITLILSLTNSPVPTNFLLTLDDIFIVDDCMLYSEPKSIQVLYWCDFESNNCSFENTMRLEWSNVSASDNIGNGPSVDHTLKTTSGHYLTASKLDQQGGGFIERVISKKVTVPDDGTSYCLSFYYYINSYSPFLYVFSIPLNGTSENFTYQINNLIWPPNDFKNNRYVFNKWAWGIANLVAGTFKLGFVVSNDQGYDIKMAVDDIKVHSCLAVNKPVKSYDPVYSYYFEYGCDFESDRCGFSETFGNWGQEYPSNWSRIDGHQTIYPSLGPKFDHTTGRQEGHFLNVNFSLPIRASFSAATRSVLIFNHFEMCIEFYYYANTEMFSPTSKSIFGVNPGGCYATSIYMNLPYRNSTVPQWTRVIIQLKGFACREFLDFGFGGGDFLKTSFAIDDFKVDRCDVLNRTTATTTKQTTTAKITTTTISSTTSTAIPTTTTITTTSTTVSITKESTTYQTSFLTSRHSNSASRIGKIKLKFLMFLNFYVINLVL